MATPAPRSRPTQPTKMSNDDIIVEQQYVDDRPRNRRPGRGGVIRVPALPSRPNSHSLRGVAAVDLPKRDSRAAPFDVAKGTSVCDVEKEDTGPERTVAGRLDAILASFDNRDHVLALNELSQRVGLPKSTVHRLSDQLCSVGWLERNSGGYRIGLRLLEFGGIALQRNKLRDAALGHIYRVASKTGCAVQLAILYHGEVVYLECFGVARFGLPTRVGGREPAYCTALGKAMLAFEVEAGRKQSFTNLRRRTESTITDPRALRAELERNLSDWYRLRRRRSLQSFALRRIAHSGIRPGDRGDICHRAELEATGAFGCGGSAERCSRGLGGAVGHRVGRHVGSTSRLAECHGDHGRPGGEILRWHRPFERH